MECPTLKFQLDVPTIERLRAQATERGISLTSLIQNIVSRYVWATPTPGDRKADDSDHGAAS
jgi:hypothetical protein